MHENVLVLEKSNFPTPLFFLPLPEYFVWTSFFKRVGMHDLIASRTSFDEAISRNMCVF